MKKLLLLLIIPFLSFGQDIYDNLFYYYSFSETDNISAIDASGNGFTATLNDVVNTTDRFGNENSAKQFNGESSFIDIPFQQGEALQMYPLSCSFWVKLDSIGHVGGVIRTEFIDNYYTGIWVNIQAESINMATGDCGSAGQQSRKSFKTNHFFLNEQWHHVVAVFTDEVNYDENVMEMKMYINGVEMTGEYTGSGQGLCYGSLSIGGDDCLGLYMIEDDECGLDWGGAIGKFDSNTPASPPPYGDTIYHFKGKLDEIGYWGRALSASEVIDIYQNGVFDECQELIDECGVCGGVGPTIPCWDGSLVCNEINCPEETGCMYEFACNFNENAVQDDGNCSFPGDTCEISDGVLGVYNENCECINDSTLLNEGKSTKKLLKTIDILSRDNPYSLQLEIYDDGSVEKKYLIK